MYALRAATLRTGRLTTRSRFGDLALIAFLVTQLSDGVLTYVGVLTFGPSIEGNPLVGWLMAALGYGPGVAAAKIAAGLFGVALHLFDVHGAVAALAGFYLLVAVGPWLAVLFVWAS